MTGFINIPNGLADDLGLIAPSQPWYEKENDTGATQTYRFSKRSDHTGLLIRINTVEATEEYG